MPLPIAKLEETLVAAVRQIANAHSTLLLTDQITVKVAELDVQVNLIAPQGEGAVEIENVTITPTRISKSTQTAKQTKGQSITSVSESQQSNSSQSANESKNDTTQYGRQTLSETEYKE